MNESVRILIVEDLTADADLAKYEIHKVLKDCEFQVVETRKDFLVALETFQPDVILSDYSLPRFDGMTALRLTLERAPLIPFIIWTGSMSEDVAVECMKAGANNYILKENIKRLAPAVVHALEERRLLQERKQAEEKYRAIFENSPEGIFQSTPDGCFINVNPAMARIYGYTSPQEMIESISDIARQIYIEPQERNEFTRLFDARDAVENFEWKNYRKDGSIIWTSTSARAVRDDMGNILYYEGFLQDITERKQAEEALEFSEKRFRALIENGLDDISLLAADGTLLWESPSTIRNLGYAQNTFIGHNIFELLHPDDLGWTQKLYEKIVQEPGSRQQGSFRLRHSTGTWRWVEAIVTNMLNEPSVNAIVVNYRDITERKQTEDALRESQNKYQNLVETSHDLIWSVDADGRITFLNRAAQEIYGYEPEELIGHSFFEIVDPPHFHQNLRNFKETIADANEFKEVESYVRHRDGRQIILSANSIVIRDDNGNVIGVTGSSHDITERKRAEEALRESEKRLILALAGAQMSVWEWNLQTNTIFWSPELFEITGIQRGDLDETFESFTNLIHPEDVSRVRASAENAVEDKTLFAEEFRILRPGGEIRWLSNLGHAEYDSMHRNLRLIGTIQDITNRKQAEIERQALFEIMQGLANTKDQQELLRLIHHSIARVISAENFFVMLYQPNSGMFEEIYFVDQYDDLPTPPNKLEKSITSYVFRSGQPLLLTQAEFDELVTKGEVELVGTNFESWLGVPLKTSGRTIGVMAVQDYKNPNRYSERDKEFLASIATQVALAIERKRAEEALTLFRSLIDYTNDTIEIIDPETGRFLDVNEQACLTHGYTREEYLSFTVSEIDPLIAARPWEETKEELQRTGSRVFESQHVRKDGCVFPVEVNVKYVHLDRDYLLAVVRDITERQRAEEALRASEERFRRYFELGLMGMAITSPTKGFIEVNDQICSILGYERDELSQITWAEITHPEDLATDVAQFNRVLAGEINSYSLDKRFIRKDGKVVDTTISVTCVRRADRSVDYIVAIMEDITERKQAEDKLRKSEERYRTLVNQLPAIVYTDDDSKQPGHTQFVSPQIETVLGFTPDEWMDGGHELWSSCLYEEDRDWVMNEYQRSIEEGKPFELEYRTIARDGRLVWLHDKAVTLRDGAGQPLEIHGIAYDITERRQAEEQLRKLSRAVEQSASTIVITNAAGNIEYVNPKFTETTGYTFEEVIGQNPRILKSGFTPNEDYEQLWQTITCGREWHGELLNKKKNGDLYWEYVTISPFSNEQGKMTHFIAVKEDITERKRAAEETSALLETSLALTNLDLKATLQTIGNSAKTLFAADGCRIFLMEPDGEFLRCVLALQESSVAFSDLRIKIGDGVTGVVAASGQAEIVNEMQNDPRSMQVSGTLEEEEAIMFAPLKERDRTIGVLSIRRMGTERPFQPADLELLEAFASMAASAVSNARLFEETQRRLAELEALYENGLAVGRLLRPSEIGNRVIDTFARYLPWHHVTIRLRQEDSDDLELVAFNLPNLKEEERVGAEQHFIARINKVGQGLSGWVIQTGVPLRTSNVRAYPQYIDTHAGIQSGLYMPLRVAERVIGVISVESEAANAFTEQDERLLATLANQAAIAFENARLYQAVQQELSERKRAEEALRASEVHYRELADSITDILFELDQDLRYTHWNKASEALTGVTAKDAIGKSMHEIFGETEEQTKIEKIYADVLRSRQPRTFETTMVLNGQKSSFEINAYPSTRGVSVVAKDVTERKRSETIMQKRFELMEYSAHHSLDELMKKTTDEVSELTGSTIGFFHFVEVDQTTLGMQTWSTNALRLFNVPVSEGTHLPLDQAGVWAEAAHQRRPLIQNDYKSLSKNRALPQGHVSVMREMVIPIIRNERIVAIMGIANKPQDYTQYDLEIAERLADYAWDITERKQMEVALEAERNQLAQRVEERTADLIRANANLARALRVKDEFLANMSHELRTPLNAILGLSESLGEQIAGPLNEKQQKYVTTIGESGHHLLSLINDILDLAKIEAGQITLDINKVDIHSVCQSSLRMIKQLAQKKNQEVILKIDDGLGLMWADERRLKQMLVNLLGNAVKFTPEDGKIGLEVHGDQQENKIMITVWDNGIGIKEGDLVRLFQPFVQLDSGLAREASGTGLGLALVAQMARLHGGGVNATSEPGKGSRFTITLPWEPALALDTATRMRITSKFRAIKPDENNKPTILLVEDTKEVIMMIRDYLELAGYKVVTAQDGIDAIAQAKVARPDLILMDVQMPRMDGLEATHILRSEPDFRYTPIIALTALAMPSDRERCLAAGMDEYISKPVNLKALVKIIQSCLYNKEEPQH